MHACTGKFKEMLRNSCCEIPVCGGSAGRADRETQRDTERDRERQRAERFVESPRCSGEDVAKMMRSVSPFAVMMARVMKTTGGKLWLKPWGVPKITKANKRNFKQRSKRIQENQVSLFEV